ncbi:MAG: hypothetical protein L3K52_04535 [Candidatus Thiothrix sulfatifontis]|nr:MAG: hypothetical protein L3K52_04535 [Candidatus Thiothrix sulfatifontis]
MIRFGFFYTLIEREAVLLQQINTPLPAQTLADYQELSQKLRDERITSDFQAV